MKEITTHHDGHGLAESIMVRAVDEPGPGGAHHQYSMSVTNEDGDAVEVGYLQFQVGPRNEDGSTPGLITEAVLAALVDHLQEFQAGDFPSRENAIAIAHLQEAQHWLRARADERARRKVLGTYQK